MKQHPESLPLKAGFDANDDFKNPQYLSKQSEDSLDPFELDRYQKKKKIQP